MRSLLDINVLVALFDEDHVFNERAHQWLDVHAAEGIATCPLTENGLVRLLSNPSYSKVLRLPPTRILAMLAGFLACQDHAFWPAEVSLQDPGLFRSDRILGNRQVTDVYLLGLAVRHGGRFVTLDGSVATSAVAGFRQEHLLVI